MARIVLVVICGVLVFVLVSKFAPHFLETVSPANPEATAAAEKEAKSKTKAKAKSATSRSRAKAAARTASTDETASTTPVAEFSSALPPDAASETPTPATDSRSVMEVAAEDATLYRTNTTRGPVIALLPKGAVVEPVFVVSTNGQNWTFVSAGDDELAGFIRSETLSRSKSTETTRQ